MDAQSLAQVEHIVTTAITTAVTGLRQELASTTAGLRQELSTAVIGLREEFTAGFAELRQDFESTRTSLRQEFQATAATLRQEIVDSREEMKRFTGILFEDSQHKLELVVEGMQFLRQSVVEVRAEIAHESRETRALLS